MQTLKPIIRWTIGDCATEGLEALRLSVNGIRKIFGDSVTLAICYNNIKPNKLPPVDLLINQEEFSHTLPFPPPSIDDYSHTSFQEDNGAPAWKLYPPRLDINTHEILLDNDIILYQKPNAIDRFLNSLDIIVATEPLKRSYSDKYPVKDNFNINTGIMAYPPGFDLRAKISAVLKEPWSNHFDEQTLIASIIQNERVQIIPITEVAVCPHDEPVQRGKCGVHLLGVNHGPSLNWRSYINIF